MSRRGNPSKHRKAVFTPPVDRKPKEVCLEISKRYESTFLELGADKGHVHLLVQSVPTYSPKKLARSIKNISARGILATCHEVKRQLWGGEFWTDGYFISTVGKHGNEDVIKKYIQTVGPDADGVLRILSPGVLGLGPVYGPAAHTERACRPAGRVYRHE